MYANVSVCERFCQARPTDRDWTLLPFLVPGIFAASYYVFTNVFIMCTTFLLDIYYHFLGSIAILGSGGAVWTSGMSES